MRLAYFDASILDDDGVPVALRYRKAAALVFYLATEERAVPRPDLAALFWPDADETSAKNNLRLALADVRKRIGDVLDADRRTVRLRPDVALENDLADFDAWARFEAPAGERPVGADGTTPVLPGLDATDAPEFAEWVDALRERVVRTAVDAWTAASDAYLREGRDEAAVDALRTALACRSWDEPTHRRLARLLASLGRRDAALAQVDAARLEIRRQLDQGPSAALDALAASLAARDAGAPGMPGAPPAPLGIVGRTAEILEIERAFLEDEQRAVVVPGAPGMGASTVAWAAARVLAPRFLGGVATWSARDVRTPDALARALRDHRPDAGDAPALLFVDDVPHLA
ncbi:MAG: BTAD domain-containing putative transcriptional regulator, partial [Trueperaceae bacterium]|nr:BTAD domain-containing putative transcriptional regulator [Trueperaceae bacterium]